MPTLPREPYDERRAVLVYRDRIGVPSEIEFCRRQYLGFRTLKPVWIGRTLLPGASQISQSTIRIGGVQSLLFRYFGAAPSIDVSQFVPVVHAQFARGGALALPFAEAMGARMVVTLHGGDIGKDKNWAHTLLARRWPRVITRTHRFVCVSDAVAEAAQKRGAPRHLLTVVPIGVPIPAEAPTMRRDPAFLFAGRFVEKKGLGVLADAMRELRANGDTTKLICAGDGPGRPLLEALAKDISGVELTGWLSQSALSARMEATRALIVPSVVAKDGDAEGLPSVVPEAMVRGCVVVGTEGGGIAEAVTNDSTGLLVPPGDSAALAAAMRRLNVEPGLASRLAREKLDAVRQSELLETILLDAADRRRFDVLNKDPSS
jgi:glycosyltransferase involved in cell wall biosynthesis